jgi:predicted transcriptional regulator
MACQNIKTLREIAAECGVSEQAVRAWCRRNHVAKDAKGSFAISESQKTAIYQHYLGVERKQVAKDAKASCETCETSLIAILQVELELKNEQLSVKDEQLAVKDKQIEELNERLAEISSALVLAQQTAHAAQALHAGTIQQLIDGTAGQPQRATKRGWLSRFLKKEREG